MTAVASAMVISSQIPKANLARASATLAFNSAEGGTLKLTVPTTFAQLRLLDATLISVVVATLPAFANDEKAYFQLLRGGQAASGAIVSKESMRNWEGNAGAIQQIFSWAHYQFAALPNILPGDILHFAFPPVDDDGSPTADIVHDLMFKVVKR